MCRLGVGPSFTGTNSDSLRVAGTATQVTSFSPADASSQSTKLTRCDTVRRRLCSEFLVLIVVRGSLLLLWSTHTVNHPDGPVFGCPTAVRPVGDGRSTAAWSRRRVVCLRVLCAQTRWRSLSERAAIVSSSTSAISSGFMRCDRVRRHHVSGCVSASALVGSVPVTADSDPGAADGQARVCMPDGLLVPVRATFRRSKRLATNDDRAGRHCWRTLSSHRSGQRTGPLVRPQGRCRIRCRLRSRRFRHKLARRLDSQDNVRGQLFHACAG